MAETSGFAVVYSRNVNLLLMSQGRILLLTHFNKLGLDQRLCIRSVFDAGKDDGNGLFYRNIL